MIKLILFAILIVYVRCEEASEASETPTIESTTGSVLESESTTSAFQMPDISWTTDQDHNSDKPPGKNAGCTSLLWSEGQKFCWARCDSSSTSSFWNTWCFTSKFEGERAGKVSCSTDDDCLPIWKCKSSCGMFSPHWDKEQRRPDGYNDW